MEFPFIEIWNILFSFEMTFETIAFFPPSFRVSCHAMGKSIAINQKTNGYIVHVLLVKKIRIQ